MHMAPSNLQTQDMAVVRTQNDTFSFVCLASDSDLHTHQQPNPQPRENLLTPPIMKMMTKWMRMTTITQRATKYDVLKHLE